MAQRTHKHHFTFGVLLIVILLAALVGANRNQPRTQAQTADACPVGYSLQVPPSVQMGGIPLFFTTPTSQTIIRDVVYKIDGKILGRGVLSGNGTQWQMVWYSQFNMPGSHYISVQVINDDGSSCNTALMPTYLQGTIQPNVFISTAVTPVSFDGLTNQVINFTLDATISYTTLANTSSSGSSSVDITQYTYFNNKSTTLGSITPLDGLPILKLSTGPVAGYGNASVIASYGGSSKAIVIPLNIIAQTSTVNTLPTHTESGSSVTSLSPLSTTSDSNSESTNPTIPTSQTISIPPATDEQIAAASTASIEAEKPVKDCVYSELGGERYKAISSGRSRPTAGEFDSFDQCFESRNYVLPSTFVPIAPKEVKNQPESDEIAVSRPTNDSKDSSTILKFHGKAKPNSVVLLYIFSEPLVLSTTADKNGDWSYSLKDPLQPGNHEIYAVVNKGDGTYQRSSALDFAIAKAEASPANPKSYSLKLSTIQPTAKENNKSVVMYIGGIVGLMVVMLSIGAVAVLKRKKNSSKSIADIPTANVTNVLVQPAVAQSPYTVVPETSHVITVPEVSQRPTPSATTLPVTSELQPPVASGPSNES